MIATKQSVAAATEQATATITTEHSVAAATEPATATITTEQSVATDAEPDTAMITTEQSMHIAAAHIIALAREMTPMLASRQRSAHDADAREPPAQRARTSVAVFWERNAMRARAFAATDPEYWAAVAAVWQARTAEAYAAHPPAANEGEPEASPKR